jgi:hypothetical protein
MRTCSRGHRYDDAKYSVCPECWPGFYKKSQSYKLKSKVIKYPGMGGWHFLAVPKATGKKIKELQRHRPRKGWGSIRVEVSVGSSVWKTSIFPDKKSGTYLLPLKAEVRKREKIGEKGTVFYTLTLQP